MFLDAWAMCGHPMVTYDDGESGSVHHADADHDLSRTSRTGRISLSLLTLLGTSPETRSLFSASSFSESSRNAAKYSRVYCRVCISSSFWDMSTKRK